MNESNQVNQDFKIPLNDKGFLLMDSVEATFKEMFNKKYYKEATLYLNYIKNNASLDNHHDIVKLHDLYIELLLEIEDYPSLLNILLSKEKYLETSKAKSIHLFYLAICYEGLKEIDKAIESLERIEDTISSQNLTNKYLKLALLYLENKNKELAYKSYKHAIIFDKQKVNDIFLLVESDLQYYDANYVDSMKKYEDFFIKSNRKLSYLNRFIRISLALNRKTDAYEFYTRYKEKVLEQASIQTKLNFFSSALIMLKEINQDAYIEANNIIIELKGRETISFDDFNYFNVLLNHMKNHVIHQKERDLIRDIFLNLDETRVFKKIVYLKIIDAKVQLLHYSKKLLLEKVLDQYHLIIDDIFKGEHKQTYPRQLIESFIYVEDDVDYIFLEKINDSEYLLTYTSQQFFDLAKKLTILTSHVLKEKLLEFNMRTQNNQLVTSLKSLLDMKNIGLFKISNHQIILMNDYAHTLLNTDLLFMQFDDFQKQLDSIIYLDELSQNKSFEVTYSGKQLKIISYTLDFDVYLLIEESKENPAKTENLWVKHQEHSILLLEISNYKTLISKLGYNNYQERLQLYINELPKLSNNHLLDYKFIANHLIYILLDTRDKRIPERLSEKSSLFLGLSFDLRFSYQLMNENESLVIDKLNYLLAYTSTEDKFIFSDKFIRKEKEIEYLYLETINKLINNKNLKLKQDYIKNWRTQKISHIEVDYHHLNILTDPCKVEYVLSKNGLNIHFDRLLVNTLINDAKALGRNMRWIVPISIESIKSKKAFNYLLRRIDLINHHQVTWLLSIDAYLSLSKEDINYLNEKKVSIALKGDLSDFSILDKMTLTDYYMIQPQLFNHEFSMEIVSILHKRFNHIIYSHNDESLVKADLERLQIDLIKGAYAGNEID